MHQNHKIKEMSCLVCYEEQEANAMYVLTRCSHESCRDCLKNWIEKTEMAGSRASPSCPFCRVEMTEKDTMTILGRSFEPAKAASPSDEEEMDELTVQWLQNQTTPCPHCGAHIEKEEGTCDMMECLCGFRFCYNCSSPGCQCSCTPANHVFWDNTNDCWADRDPKTAQDFWKEETDQEDLWEKLLWTTGQSIREARDCRAEDNQREQDELEEPISRAPWLFCSREAGLRTLNSIMNAKNTRKERVKAKAKFASEQRHMEEVSFGSRWLFYPEKFAAWILAQQLQREGKLLHRTGGVHENWREEWDHNRAKVRKRMLRRAACAGRATNLSDSFKCQRNRQIR